MYALYGVKCLSKFTQLQLAKFNMHWLMHNKQIDNSAAVIDSFLVDKTGEAHVVEMLKTYKPINNN